MEYVVDVIVIIYIAFFLPSLWVGFDARKNRVSIIQRAPYSRKNGALMWYLACIYLWIVFFPLYLWKRHKTVAQRKTESPPVAQARTDPSYELVGSLLFIAVTMGNGSPYFFIASLCALIFAWDSPEDKRQKRHTEPIQKEPSGGTNELPAYPETRDEQSSRGSVIHSGGTPLPDTSNRVPLVPDDLLSRSHSSINERDLYLQFLRLPASATEAEIVKAIEQAKRKLEWSSAALDKLHRASISLLGRSVIAEENRSEAVSTTTPAIAPYVTVPSVEVATQTVREAHGDAYTTKENHP